MNQTRLVPSDIESEQATLGGLLMDEGAILRVLSIVKPCDFYLEKHGWIFDAIRNVNEHGESIDFLTVVSELERVHKLDTVGGAAYITALICSVPTSIHVETYARKVADLAGKRRIISAAGLIAEYAYDGLDYSAAYARSQEALLDVAPNAGAHYTSGADSIADSILRFRLRQNEPCDFVGITTGLIDFDDKMRGFQAGLHVIQGQTSHGKTAFALAIGEGVSSNDFKRVLFCSMEMGEKQIADRRLAYACGISTDELLTAKIKENNSKRLFNAQETKRVEDAGFKLSNHHFDVVEMCGSTSSEIVALITERKARYGLDLAVVDYVQLCADDVDGGDVKRLGQASKNLKLCADKLHLPIILISQVNRKVNDREIKIAGVGDSRGSGEVDENADSLITIYSADAANRKTIGYKRTNEIDVFIDKDRLGGAAGRACKLGMIERTGAIVNRAR